MEIPIIGGLALLGFMLGKNNTQNSKNIPKQNDNNQQKNVYDNKRYNEARKQEMMVKNDFFEKSKDPVNKNVIPEQFNQRIVNDPQIQQNSTLNKQNNQNDDMIYSSLTGTTMSKEHFTHDNQNNNLMVPFFGGKNNSKFK